MPGRGKKRGCDELDVATGVEVFMRAALPVAPAKTRNMLRHVARSTPDGGNISFDVRGNYTHL